MILTPASLSKIDDLDNDIRYQFGSEQGLGLDNHDLDFMIGKDETWLVEIWIQIDTGDGTELIENSAIEIALLSDPRTIEDSITAHIDPLYPDLRIMGEVGIFDEDNELVQGSTPEGRYHLSFKVTNDGHTSTEKGILLLTIGEEKIYHDIPQMEPGEIRDMTIAINLTKGSHIIMLEIDPANFIHEEFDQFVDEGALNNNQYRLTVEVEEEKDLDLLLVVFVILTLLAFILVPITILLLIFNRRKPVPQEE